MTFPGEFDDTPPEGVARPQVLARPTRRWLAAVAAAALLGALFSAISTADFIAHLDRQVHSIHCSYFPGGGRSLGESGCRAVMMSPYSSLFRDSMWGGLPISLLALAVFAYLVYRSVDFARRDRVTTEHTRFLIAATLLPVLASVVYASIAILEVGSVCKLCVGVYAASAAGFVFAVVAHRCAEQTFALRRLTGVHARWFGEGVAYVAVMTLLYVAFAPVSDRPTEGCGRLTKTADRAGILIPFAGSNTGEPSVVVLDPLCSACRSFDRRLEASGKIDRLNLRLMLFPLDAACNWMVKDSLHRGACAVSEAILCSPDRVTEVVGWAFDNQEDLLAMGRDDGRALRRRLAERFPKAAKCLGSARIKNKLNKSLRWAVANALPVLTPQLIVGDRRVCDEDTDLGLEYTLAAVLEGRK